MTSDEIFYNIYIELSIFKIKKDGEKYPKKGLKAIEDEGSESMEVKGETWNRKVLGIQLNTHLKKKWEEKRGMEEKPLLWWSLNCVKTTLGNVFKAKLEVFLPTSSRRLLRRTPL